MCPNISYRYRKLEPVLNYLEIERGRYTEPKTDLNQVLCAWCIEIEHEEHLITKSTN